MTCLVLVTSAFQSWLARQALAAEHITDYDVIFFAAQDNLLNRLYSDSIAERSRHSWYVVEKQRRPNVLNKFVPWMKALKATRGHDYDRLMFASLDAEKVTYSIIVWPQAEVITIDDGLSNVIPSGIYKKGYGGFRDSLYRKLMWAPSLRDVKSRITRHYTMFGDLVNIVPKSQCRTISLLSGGGRNIERETMTIFVGQPFHEVLTTEQMGQLKAAALSVGCNYYLLHPRERAPLFECKILDRQGRIAEELISKLLVSNTIILVGWCSAAMISLAPLVDKVRALLPTGTSYSAELIDLLQQAKCEVVELK